MKYNALNVITNKMLSVLMTNFGVRINLGSPEDVSPCVSFVVQMR